MLPNKLRGPVAPLALLSKLVCDTGQKNAHRREPLLAVDDPLDIHHSRGAGFGEGEKVAAVVRCSGTGSCNRHEVFDEPLNIGLPPTVSPLPAWHYVLDVSVEEILETDVMRVHRLAVRFRRRRILAVSA